CPSRRRCSAKVTSRIAFATETPTAIIAPMNDCTLSVVPAPPNASTTPRSTAGIIERITSEARSDWKLATSSRKITAMASSSPNSRPDCVCRIGGTWPRTSARARTRRSGLSRRAAQVRACDVAGDRNHPLLVVAIVLADRRSETDFGHVTGQRARSVRSVHRYALHVFDRGDARLRDFDLHLIGRAARRVAPVNRLCETG